MSRYGLAALVTEACQIYGLNNQGQPGADWCVPEGDWQARLDEYFRDTPRRVAEGTNGYKADMLHGVWAQAPYLHNGSVPTLGHLLCSATRPPRFLRGNLHYDEALVGFEWSTRPAARYSPNETLLVKEYDTTVAGKANGGHTFGSAPVPGHVGAGSGAGPCRNPDADTAVARGSAARVPEDVVRLYNPIAAITSAENFVMLKPGPRSSPRRTTMTPFDGTIIAYWPAAPFGL